MEILISVLICFLSVYGILQLLYNLAYHMTKSESNLQRRAHKIVVVTNDSLNLESYIRHLAIKEEDENVILLDRADDHEMIHLMYNLSNEFDFVSVMSFDEYMRFIENDLLQQK